MASGTNRSLQAKYLKSKKQTAELSGTMLDRAQAFKYKVQVNRPEHERAEQRTRLLQHW